MYQPRGEVASIAAAQAASNADPRRRRNANMSTTVAATHTYSIARGSFTSSFDVVTRASDSGGYG